MASGAEDPFAPKLRKLFFLMSETVTMLMMPPAPCALYRAEGLVMTSIFSMSKDFEGFGVHVGRSIVKPYLYR